jgi:hypothetical protein
MPEPLILSVNGRAPEVHDESWVANVEAALSSP